MSNQFDEHFSAAEQKYGLPSGLLKKVAETESNFNPNAVSPKGAIGLMQFMPGTAERFGINPRDPIASIDAAGKYLASNFKMFKDWSHAVAGYNWGEGNVQKMIAKGDRTPPNETRKYVQKVLGGLTGKASPDAPVVDAGTPPLD